MKNGRGPENDAWQLSRAQCLLRYASAVQQRRPIEKTKLVVFIGWGLFLPGTWVSRAGYGLAGLIFGLVLLAAPIAVDRGGWLAQLAVGTAAMLVVLDSLLGLALVANFNRGHVLIRRRRYELMAALATIVIAAGAGRLLMPMVGPIPPRVLREAATAAAREAVALWDRIHKSSKHPCDPKKEHCIEQARPPLPEEP